MIADVPGTSHHTFLCLPFLPAVAVPAIAARSAVGVARRCTHDLTADVPSVSVAAPVALPAIIAVQQVPGRYGQ